MAAERHMVMEYGALGAYHAFSKRQRANRHNQTLANAPIKMELAETGTPIGVIYSQTW
jgi:hypothetical protein